MEIDCEYRYATHPESSDGAQCRLVELLLADDTTTSEVSIGACEVCVSQRTPARIVTPTVWTLVYNALEAKEERSTRQDRLAQLAEQSVVASEVGLARPSLACCDVVLCVSIANETTKASIESILDQQDASIVLHLVDDGGAGASIIDHYREHPLVVVHRNVRPVGPVRTLHSLLPSLTTQFVALQDERSLARSMRIAASVQRLMEFGDCMVGTLMSVGHRQIGPLPIAETNGYWFPWQTLTFRRSVLIDMGGFSDGDEQAWRLMLRAAKQKRRIGRLAMVTVESGNEVAIAVPATDVLHVDNQHALVEGPGFDEPQVECDVVLPFRDHLDYVEESLNALLGQVNCRPVIHLVDDASRESVSEFLDRWRDHPQVRVYRNSSNIGQFTSFNNILPYVESDWVAVQDADDISYPERLWKSVNALTLAEADVFGCAVELFGADRMVTPNRQGEPELQDRIDVRYSFHPMGAANNYFLENPTAVFRVSTFKSLGGFSDFGSVARNRASLDTEFYIRAHHAGARVFASRQVLLKYRCHPESATQNTATGWGTDARMAANDEVERRSDLMRSGSFDPRVFGALGRYQAVTTPLR